MTTIGTVGGISYKLGKSGGAAGKLFWWNNGGWMRSTKTINDLKKEQAEERAIEERNGLITKSKMENAT